MRLLIIGAGGHAASLIDVVEMLDGIVVVGLVGTKAELNSHRYGYKVIGTDKDLPNLRNDCDHAIVAIGQIKSASLRLAAFENIKKAGFQIPTIISPLARVSPHAVVKKGSAVMHGAIINSNVSIGENCIINTSAVVEHGARIGSHTHLATSSTINGDVSIGDECFIGSSATIRNGISIGHSVIISMGVTVKYDKPDQSVVLQND